MFFQRKIYSRLLDFKKDGGRHSLLIEGARRIGKTTVLREFAKNEYASSIVVDFQADGKKAQDAFKELPDIDSFFRVLMLNYNTILTRRNSLIVFDEIQFFPKAREALKQLVADRRYDFIATGSLISIEANVKDILIPSEEESVSMHPLDFEEFCQATGNELLHSYLKECFLEGKQPKESQHQKAMKLFRLYLAVGGMPQAVSDLTENRSFQEIDKTKRLILSLYAKDLRKIDAESSLRCDAIFKHVPHALQSHSKQFRAISIFPSESKIKFNSFNAIEDSKIVNICRNADMPSVDFNQYASDKNFKIYMADTGLLTTRVYEDSDEPLEDGIYRRLIGDKLSTNDGMLYENAVAQEFISRGRKLYYHSFSDESRHKYELDFLLRKGKKVIPIEVKSSKSSQHASLDRAIKKYSSTLAEPIVLSPRNYSKEGPITFMPVYMAGLLADSLAK